MMIVVAAVKPPGFNRLAAFPKAFILVSVFISPVPVLSQMASGPFLIVHYYATTLADVLIITTI